MNYFFDDSNFVFQFTSDLSREKTCLQEEVECLNKLNAEGHGREKHQRIGTAIRSFLYTYIFLLIFFSKIRV